MTLQGALSGRVSRQERPTVAGGRDGGGDGGGDGGHSVAAAVIVRNGGSRRRRRRHRHVKNEHPFMSGTCGRKITRALPMSDKSASIMGSFLPTL